MERVSAATGEQWFEYSAAECPGEVRALHKELLILNMPCVTAFFDEEIARLYFAPKVTKVTREALRPEVSPVHDPQSVWLSHCSPGHTAAVSVVTCEDGGRRATATRVSPSSQRHSS